MENYLVKESKETYLIIFQIHFEKNFFFPFWEGNRKMVESEELISTFYTL